MTVAMIANKKTPTTLKDEELIAATRNLAHESNAVAADLIEHLAEMDARKLYLQQAQASLFAWCVAELGGSEDAVCNWIAVARLTRRLPAVLVALRAGRVHLTGLRMLGPHLTDDNHRAVLDEAAGKSKREIAELVARRSLRPPVASSHFRREYST